MGQHFARAQWVEVRQEVAPDPVHVDEPKDVRLLLHVAVGLFGHQRRAGVRGPLHRLVRDAQRCEDPLVEAVAPGQHLLELRQEQPALRPLDDSVVVGAGDPEDLPHPEFRQGRRIRSLEFGGVVDAAGGDDEPLALHQARDRELRPDRPGIG